MTPVTDSWRRHFPNRECCGPEDPATRAALVLRLLEDGHGEDLAWLSSRVAEADLASLFRQRGCRQLSRRSRAFWKVVLGVEAGEPPPIVEELWPL